MMAKKGVDVRDLPQLLDSNYAQEIVNYTVSADGQLLKRKGLLNLTTIAGNYPVTMMERFTDDIILFAYNTTLAAYVISTDTVTSIKTDFTASTYEGRRYGDYFFITNKKERPFRISRTLAYDAQTANFTTGKTLTGATSGATATILQDSDSGATGTLTLGNVSGTFTDNEIITDTVTGSATVNGSLTWAAAELTSAPRAGTLEIIGPRLYLGNLESDSNAIAYSSTDDSSNPPFNGSWTAGTLGDDPGLVTYRNGGTIRAIRALGQTVIGFGDTGKFGFQVTVQDLGGIETKLDTFIFDRQDFGGARAAISTADGLFYVNELGLWKLISVGQSNVPFSDQEALQSILLGNTYFDNISFSSATMINDEQKRYLYISCANASSVNNFVLAYNLDSQSFSTFNGWNINRFININGTIYGGSSIATTLYQCFEGFDDDGLEIGTEFTQELRLGELYTRQDLIGCYVQGFLSDNGSLTVGFDIYNANGEPTPDRKTFTWTAQYNLDDLTGWGTSEYGRSAWGGDNDYANTIESFDGCRPFIRNVQRVILHITGSDTLPHIINWVSLQAKQKVAIRRRHLTLNS